MTDRYAVIGNPIEHSKSPFIHAAFARATGEDLEYGRILAPLDGFVAAVSAFRASGGRGLNVTLPFKGEAFTLADTHSERARMAQAVNTLAFDGERVFGDNTDGVGLVRDIRVNLGVAIAGLRILLLGAGGAGRGVVLPLLAEAPRSLVIANRTASKALELARQFAGHAGAASLCGCGFDAIESAFDIVVNATAASLAGEALRLPHGAFAPGCLAYDMMYAKQATPFMVYAQAQGATQIADGLGMLVEQAAESFFIWRGKRPDTAPVLAELRR